MCFGFFAGILSCLNLDRFREYILERNRVLAGKDIVEIISVMGLVGWIPIWFFFKVIVKIIRAFKGLDDDYDRKNMSISIGDMEEDE